MALDPGTPGATSGLSKAVFDALDAALAPKIAAATPPEGRPAALASAREGWRTVADAVGGAVVAHLKANLEIRGVVTSGTVNAPVTAGVARQNALQSTQTNSGQGLVA
jgi:hypothetical protein